MNYEILLGDNRDTLKTLEDNSVDAVVTDPPYGIDFLGKSWDANTGALETYTECLRVLKPGGYILAFSAARTYHHLAITLEQAGFEIRDQLMWLYASGFPKAQDIGKAIQRRQGVEEYEEFVDTTKNAGFGQTDHARVRAGVEWSTKETQVGKAKCTSPMAQQWEGWKTALKPAHEPICMARKPFKGSTIDNVLAHGVGALNIDATRIDSETLTYPAAGMDRLEFNQQEPNKWQGETVTNEQGRFPSNVLGEVEGYQKFFYCPKVSRKERHIGHTMPDAMLQTLQGSIPTEDKKGNGIDRVCETCGVSILKPQDCHCETKSWVRPIKTGNNHPTVKPVALMRYLIQLVTPPNSVVLDPFNGSGSTGMAAVELGHTYIGCELDPDYVEIAKQRIVAWNTEPKPENSFNEMFTKID